MRLWRVCQQRPRLALIIALSCLGLLRLLWPGDASFVSDEPALIDRAWQANQRSQLSVLGLRGTRGLHYGPLPLWIYQALLTVTDDVVTLAAIKAGLVALLSAVALWWIARSAPSLWTLGGALAFLSPYLWLYGRDLWDNSFCIPLSALSFAAYLAFVRSKQRWALLLLTLGLSCLVLTHLMSLALIVPLLLHLLLTQHRWLRQHLCFAACCLAGALLLSGSYVGYLIRAPMPTSFARTGLSLEQMILPLMGARFFSLTGLGYFFGQDWPLGGRWVLVAAYITWIAFGLVAIGVCHSILEVRATWKSRHSLAFNLHTASLAVLGGQVGQWVLMRLDDHPHYFNATWIVFFFFLWSGLSLLWRATLLLRVTVLVYGGALAAGLLAIVFSLHQSGGTRSLRYGPTLANQAAVARELNRHHPASRVIREALHPRHFPHAIDVLQRLDSHRRSKGNGRPVATLRIVYLQPRDQRNGRIGVEVLSP